MTVAGGFVVASATAAWILPPPGFLRHDDLRFNFSNRSNSQREVLLS